MNRIECSTETPWGIHLAARNDESCPRCGWIAPGPAGDAAQATEEPSERLNS